MLVSVLALGDGGLFSFLWQHAAGEHGFPEGLASVSGFFENLISFGVKSGLHKYNPVTSFLLYLSLVGLVLRRERLRHLDPATIFFLGWLAGSVLFMSPFNYLPLRYLFVLMIPVCALVGLFLSDTNRVAVGVQAKPSIITIVLLILLNWYFSYYVIVHLFVSLDSIIAYFRYVWIVLPAGLFLTGLQLSLLRGCSISIPSVTRLPLFLVLLLLCAFAQGRYFYQWEGLRAYSLVSANSSVSQILNENAVVSGQYGPAVTADNNTRSLPHFLTADLKGAALTFREYPVTHLAVGASDWKTLLEKHTGLQKASIVARFWLRDNTVYLVRINEMFGNAKAERYQLTDFEIAMQHVSDNMTDSALIHLNRFLRRYPDNQPALLEAYYLTVQDKTLDSARPIMDKLVSEYDTDFSVCIMAAIYYKWLHERTGDSADDILSKEYLERAIRYNRRNENNLRLMYKHYLPTARILS